jgi:hypothetical protein
MCRAVVAALLSVAVGAVVCAREAGAQTSAAEPIVTRDEEWKLHAIGLRFETDGTCFSYGIYYAHYWASASLTDGLGPIGMAGAGLQVRLVTEQHRDIGAILVGPIGRIAMMGDAGGASSDVSLDLSLGPGPPLLVGSAAIAFGYLYADAGYVYQFPLPGFDRPSWMASHQFGARAMFPVRTYDYRFRETVK